MNTTPSPSAGRSGGPDRRAAGPLFQPAAVTAAFDRLITPDTDAVICNHVSQRLGFVQPVEEIAALCRQRASL